MTLDTTIGGTTATSYASLVEAQAYAGDQRTAAATAWLAGTADDQEGTLRQATRLLDTFAWKGLKLNNVQALEWPRSWVEDKNYYPIYPTVIPPQVKNAQCELAIRLFADDRGQEDARLATSEKVGSLQVEYEAGTRPRVVTSLVTALCGQFIDGGGSTVAVQRS